MTYRDELLAVADATEAQAVALYGGFLGGAFGVGASGITYTAGEFVAFLASLIAQANSTVYALADLSVSASIMLATAEPVPVLGLTPPVEDLPRLTKAAETVLEVADESPVPDKIIRRLARSEPLETAARAISEAMDRQPAVTGWVRDISGGACQLCQWWARDGRVWPADHPMPTHKGCSCTPKPVVVERIQPVSKRRR
ncbi:hypothetical protein ACN27E_09780 [Mycobacterium sp. WMMD1722]|uniref:hypothetical protein n=1 Tax=Mycobacterium sp. WMMD1722 TaxID=3404117 RepID=UPI003BF4EE4D